MADAAAPMPKARGRGIPTYYYYIGAAGIVGAYYLYKRSKTKAATTAAASNVATPGAAANVDASGNLIGSGYTTDASGNVVPVGTTAATNVGDMTDLLAQIEALQGAAATPAATTTTTAGYTAPTNIAQSGGGYKSTTSAVIAGANGHSYEQFAGYPQAAAFLKSGGKVFYQPLPGVFTQVNALNKGSNTYYYGQVS